MGEVMVHLPAMIEQLELSGGGVVSYLAAQEIIDDICGVQPQAAVAVERARLSGVGTGLTWEEVGPVYANADNVERYEHGAGFSQSFQVWRAPAGVFRESSMMALLKPDDISERSGHRILYRPMTMEQSQSRVQTAVADAGHETNQKGRKATGAQLASAGRVKQTETEVSARGAALAPVLVHHHRDGDGPCRAAACRPWSAMRRRPVCGCSPRLGNEDASFAIGLQAWIVEVVTVSPRCGRRCKEAMTWVFSTTFSTR